MNSFSLLIFRECRQTISTYFIRPMFTTGEDPMLSDQQQYRYMTVDDMKSMADDSMRMNVTDDERDNRHSGGM